MWNRQQVKEQAKQIMKRNYWKMFLVTLIAGILSTEYSTVAEPPNPRREPLQFMK